MPVSVTINGVPVNVGNILAVTVLVTAAILLVIFIALDIFVFNPLEYSSKSWFRHNTDGTQTGRIWNVFNSPEYHNVVKTLLMRDLYIFLWSLLLVIPGIIKSYQYYFVPELLVEHPDMSTDEILNLSKEMTMGHKWELFVFGLSFLGWELLSAFTFGITGIFFSDPYRYMSHEILFLDYLEAGCDPYYEREQEELVQ